MRHYEITFIVHPDQSDQANPLIEKYSSQIKKSKGVVHRAEDIGLRKLAYPIQDQFKGHYILMNIECNQETISEIKSSLKFNDSIIRDLILIKNESETGESALSKVNKVDQEKEKEMEKEKESYEKEKLDSFKPRKEKLDVALSKKGLDEEIIKEDDKKIESDNLEVVKDKVKELDELVIEREKIK